MKQHFEDFKKGHPEVAKAMGMLGMSYEEYCEAYNREVLRKIMEPPRISMSDHTEPISPTMAFIREFNTTLR